MKKYCYLTGIFLIFIILRLISIDSIYLWLDEVDFMGNTFREQTWYHPRFVPRIDDEGWSVLGRDTWLETIETSFFITTNATTAPWFPVFLLHLLTYLLGHHLLLLRLPALLASLASLFFLYRILTRLVNRFPARYLTLLCFSFSVPAIIYGQSPQPVIYYFLSTVIQTSVLITVLRRSSPFASVDDVCGDLRLLTRVSLLVFFLNYMSLLICLIYLVYYLAAGAGKWRQRFSVRDYGRILGELFFNLLPLGILAFLRYRVGDHRIVYEVENPVVMGRLIFEALTYHFNFAYTPGLYIPRALNPVAWPFIAVFLAGVIGFFIRNPARRLAASLAGLVFLLFVFFQVMPIGPIRHTFTFAPLLYIFFAYGIQNLGDLLARRSVSERPITVASAILAGLLLFVFLFSGVQLYQKRRPSLDLDEIVELARAKGVTTVAGFRESVIILELMSRTAGDILEEEGIGLCWYDPRANLPPPGRHLLVAYRHAFDPPFTGMAWGGKIPLRDYLNARIIPLKEEPGPLEPQPDIMAHQSIYYPLNGAFIYLVEPESPSGE